MPDRAIDVSLTDSFRAQVREQGFSGRPELLAATIKAEAERSLPPPDASGRYWFERRTIPRGRRLASKSIWLGGTLENGVLVLSDVRTETPRS